MPSPMDTVYKNYANQMYDLNIENEKAEYDKNNPSQFYQKDTGK